MRLVMAGLVIAIIASVYLVCPKALREDLNDAMMPSEEVAQEISDGIDVIQEYFRGLEDIARG